MVSFVFLQECVSAGKMFEPRQENQKLLPRAKRRMHKVHRVLDSLLQCVLRRVRLRRPIFHRSLQRREIFRTVQQRSMMHV